MKMKKLLMAIMLVGLFCGYAFAVLTPNTDENCASVSGSTNLTECKYEIATVADNATTEYSIITENSYGNITAISVNNASIEFDFWVATAAGQDKSNAILSKDIILFYENKNLIFSPDFALPRNFRNRTGSKLLYFWMKNDDGANATGTNYVTIVFGR
jgi:hypothetical protein